MRPRKTPFIDKQSAVGPFDVDQKQTALSAETINEIILKRSVVRAEQKRGYNASKYAIPTRPAQVVNLPGDTVMLDVGFFGDENPINNYSTVRFNIPQVKVGTAFPEATYYHDIFVNNAANPFIYQPPNPFVQNNSKLDSGTYGGMPTQEPLRTAQQFTAHQNAHYIPTCE